MNVYEQIASMFATGANVRGETVALVEADGSVVLIAARVGESTWVKVVRDEDGVTRSFVYDDEDWFGMNALIDADEIAKGVR